LGLAKKGFFFTFIALLLTSIFIIMFSSNTAVAPRPTLYSEHARIEVIDALTKDLKDVFLPRVMVSSSKQALDLLMQNISESGKPIDDVSLRASELLLYGTLYGVSRPEIANHTLYKWSRNISILAEKHFRMKTNITFSNVRVYQRDPWRITIASDYYIVTNYTDIVYRIQGEIMSNMSITGYQDPLITFYSHSYGHNRTIRRALTASFNISETKAHIDYATFNYREVAPSFVMRMMNITQPSACCEIESILNSSFGHYNLSYVDHLFFNKTYECPGAFGIFNVTDFNTIPYHAGVNVKLDANSYAFFILDPGESDVNVCD